MAKWCCTSVSVMVSPRSTFARLTITLCCWILLVEGGSVDLTIREGVSLVGENCPGIVTLECEAIDTNQLRWRFNDVNTIAIYFADNSPAQSVPSQTAFPSVELTAISRNAVDLNRANYSSILTANLSRLQSDGITDIECGDASSFKVLPVSVEIIEPTPPQNPMITLVTAEYQSEGLDSVTIEWRKSDNYCPSYGLNFTYQVNITSERSTLVEHDSTVDLCVTYFKDFGGEREFPIQISIMASNELGSSDLVLYMFTINRSEQSYFRPNILFSNNQFIVECHSVRTDVTGSVCNVSYTTDPLCTGLSEPLTSMVDEPLIIEELNTCLTYYFEFSLLINGSLNVIEQTNFTSKRSTGPSNTDSAVVIGVVVPLSLIITICVVCVVVVILYRKTVKTENVCTQEKDSTTDVLFDDDPIRPSATKEFQPTQLIALGNKNISKNIKNMKVKSLRFETAC